MSLRNIDWDWQKLRELIEARGDNVIYETGISCTCRNGDVYGSTVYKENVPASYRRMNCSTCQGDGFIYRNARIIKGLLTSVQPGNRKLIDAGYAIPGDMTFSPFPGERLSDFDKITLMYPDDVNEGQVILRGAAHMDENNMIDTDLETNEDRLWYHAAYTIWCEDENGVVYSPNADFEFVDGRKIRWIGNTPNKGTLYTIKYTAYLEWLIYASPFERFDRSRDLGQRVLLRKKHVSFKTGSKADTPGKRQSEQTDFTTHTKI